ncbi:hypothetical protein L6452_39732 [Arctium lappa]|uniref:Uncharacterized protein n=1 Tax=Arctium lappa TaxID=4217 RepID=A0ACB8XX94_ARCLA|nr:hypothetical protein L6452_39732 [Arctium lappa]
MVDMECNKDEALRAKEISEAKLVEKDFVGAKKLAQKAEKLFAGLEGLSQLLITLDVYISLEKKINGESDWYNVLGVEPTADDETIRKNYRKLALTLHPDKNKSIGAEGAFKLVSEAWTLLSDKVKRKFYDQKRNPRPVYQKTVTETQKTSTSTTQPTQPIPRPPNTNTFWTKCTRCLMHFEYLKVFQPREREKKTKREKQTPTTMENTTNHQPSAIATAPPPFPPPQQPYQHLLQQQQQQLQMFWTYQRQEIEQVNDFKNHQLPLARIKKIMKADEDVRMISAEAPILFAKACELFILELTIRSWLHAEENKRRTLQKNDIAAAITRTDIFDFLVDIVPRDEIKDDVSVTVSGGGGMVGSMAASGVPYYYPPMMGGGAAAMGRPAVDVYGTTPSQAWQSVWQNADEGSYGSGDGGQGGIDGQG